MADPLVLEFDADFSNLNKKVKDGTDQISAAFAGLNSSIDSVTDEMEKLSGVVQKLGASSAQAGGHIKQMGAAGAASAASFKLLGTSITGAVEVMTGGGIQAGINLIKELGDGAENIAGHFGKIGEAIGGSLGRITGFSVVLAGIAAAGGEVARISAEDTIQINALAQSMGTTAAQVLQLRDRFGEVGISLEQLGTFARNVQIRIQESWVAIQRAVRDASLPLIQDQVAIKEATMATAAAVEEASTAQANAERAHAEAVVNASEAVINAKEAEFDAQNKGAEAQRAYDDAITNSKEAQMSLAETQKDVGYTGEDAWRGMKDAIDAVSEAERKAADEATAVQEALLSIDQAATSVKGAYASLYAAQLAYREAHGGGRITRQERAQMQRQQTEVGLESAQERVRSAEFGYARTARDAVPQAQEQQGKADRDVQAAKEAEDKADLTYREAGQKSLDRLQKAGSSAAEALEHVAKAGLELELAPQKAADETTKAQLDVEGSLAAVRKTAFEATQAAAKAEDALVLARTAQTAATNKAIDDLNNNINAITQYIRTGRGPPGFNIRQTEPGNIGQAFIAASGGGPDAFLHILQNLQTAFQSGIIPIEKLDATLRSVGAPTRGGVISPETEGLFRPAAPGHPAAAPIVQPPTDLQQRQGEALKANLDQAERFNSDQIKAINAVKDAVDNLGAKMIPMADWAARQVAEHPATAIAGGGVADILGGTFMSALASGIGSFLAGKALGGAAGGAATGGAAAAVGTASVAAEEGLAAVATELGVAEGAAITFAGALAALAIPVGIVTTTILGLIALIPKMKQQEAEGPHSASVPAAIDALLHGKSLEEAQVAAMAGQQAKTKPSRLVGIEEDKPLPPAGGSWDLPPAASAQTTKQPPGGSGPYETGYAVPVGTPPDGSKPPETGQVTIVGQTDPLAVNVVSEQGAPPLAVEAAGQDEESKSDKSIGGERLVTAADHLDAAAKKLDDVADKLAGVKDTGVGGATGGSSIEDAVKKLIDAATDKVKPQPAARFGEDTEKAEHAEDVHQLMQAQIAAIKKGAGAGGGGGGGGGGAVAPADGGEGGPVASAGGGNVLAPHEMSAAAIRQYLTGGGGGVGGGPAPTNPDSLYAPGGNRTVTTTMPDGEKFNTTVIKLDSATETLDDVSKNLSGAVNALGDVVDKSGQSAGHAAGGMVNGPGGIDKVPIMATAGEYVVNASSTSRHRSLLEQINSGEGLHFQFGGFIPNSWQTPPNIIGDIMQHGGTEPSTGAIQSALTSSIGLPGGYMGGGMQGNPLGGQMHEIDLRTDHGIFPVMATEDQMASILQSAISSKVSTTGFKPSWWS